MVALLLQFLFDMLDKSAGRSAAVVADAVKEHHAARMEIYLLFGILARPLKALDIAGAVAALVGNLKGGYLGSVKAPPHKRVGNLGVFVVAGAHHDICVHSALFDKLRKHSGVTERIDIVSSFAYSAEFFIVVKL